MASGDASQHAGDRDRRLALNGPSTGAATPSCPAGSASAGSTDYSGLGISPIIRETNLRLSLAMASSDASQPGGRPRLDETSDTSQLRGKPRPGKPLCTVMALGLKTKHWKELKKEYPGVVNCCINVVEAFGRGPRRGGNGCETGFDKHVRERIMARSTWETVWGVALEVLMAFGLLVVLCKHGRHRSLSLAYELHEFFGVELVSIVNPSGRYRGVSEFMKAVSLRLSQHVLLFGQLPHPVVGVFECIHRFDGPQWQQSKDAHHMYLDLSPNGRVILVRHTEEGSQDWVRIDSKGWAHGRLVGKYGDHNLGFLPYNFVKVMELTLTLLPPRFALLSFDLD